MKNIFSEAWKGSKQPRKQRKYRYNAPAHIRGKMLASPLSKELRKKYSQRSIRVRTGDKVKVLRGQFKGQESKVDRIDLKKYKVFLEKAEIVKKDGSKTFYPIDPSNVMITELNTDDKRRMKKAAQPAAKPAAKKDDAKQAATKTAAKPADVKPAKADAPAKAQAAEETKVASQKGSPAKKADAPKKGTVNTDG